MNIQHEFERLKSKYLLKDSDYYFLDLIPLIEIIWSDGKNQQAELSILYKFVVEHISHMDQQAGVRVVTTEQANDFLDRFAHQHPPQALLDELNALFSHYSHNKTFARKNTLLEFCLDIAAACTTDYPYDMHERIMIKEKHLLQRLFNELHIGTDRTIAGDRETTYA